MKILLVNHFPLEGSGSGVYTRNLAIELTERGHEVMVIFTENQEPKKEIFQLEPIYFKGENSKFWDLDYNFPCFTSHPRSNNTYYELTDSQIESYVDLFIRKVKDAAEKFKPDLIHAQHLWIAPYAASKAKVPYVITAHGTDLKGFKKDVRYHKYALSGAHNAFKVITISKQVDEEARNLYSLDNDKTKIVMNGYDENLFKPKDLNRQEVLEGFNIKTKADYIVSFVGKLTHFKGVDLLLKASNEYSEFHDKTVLTLIAGYGDLYSELLDLKERLNLKNMKFLGHLSQEKLVDLYNIADVSTVPSRVEPFGLVAIEALGCGTPVVATNQGGLVDFINDKVGTLVEVDNVKSLAEGIKRELSIENKKERSQYCHKYAKENFSWEKTLNHLEKIYKEGKR